MRTSYLAYWKVKWCRHFAKCSVPKELNTRLPYNPEITILVITLRVIKTISTQSPVHGYSQDHYSLCPKVETTLISSNW